MGLLRQVLGTAVLPSPVKIRETASTPLQVELAYIANYFFLISMTHLALVEGLILQDISLAAVNFIMTDHMKKHWYHYINQDQLLNVIDMLKRDLEELPEAPYENLSIRLREEWMVSLS